MQLTMGASVATTRFILKYSIIIYVFIVHTKKQKRRKITCKSYPRSFSCKPSLGEVWKKKFNGRIRNTRSAIHFRLSKLREAVLFHDEDTGTAYLKVNHKTTYIPLFTADKHPIDGFALLQKIHRALRK